MADIFISYAREDNELVRELVRDLEGNGNSIFWDRDIAVGVDFQEALETELEACSCVLVVWSAHSVRSEWVRAEAQNGLTRNVLVPIQIDQEPPPIIFRHLETLQLQGYPGEHNPVSITKLKNSINRILAFDSAAENTLTEPIRDDPTLSVRLAKRVLDALNDSERETTESCLYIQRRLSESLTALVAGASWPAVRKELMSSVAEQLNAGWSVVSQESNTIVDSDDKLAEPQQGDSLLRYLSSASMTDAPILIGANDTEVTELLAALDCSWLLTIGSDPTICFMGTDRSNVPAEEVRQELDAVAKAVKAVERAAA